MGSDVRIEGEDVGPDRLLEEMRSFHERSTRMIGRLLGHGGGSLARMKLLAFIGNGDAVRSADIAATFGYAPRTVTEAIDGLERDGLIRREMDPADRRAKRLCITPEGRSLLQLLEPVRNAYVRRIFDVIDRNEVAALFAILLKLNAALDDE